MKAITYHRYGPPEVLQVEQVNKPIVGDHDVLVKVWAAEATKSDCEMRCFQFAVKWFWLPLRLAVGISKPRRKILGGYFAGEIASVGASVTDYSVGDQVFGAAGLKFGAYGEYVGLPANSTVVAKPGNMSFEEAAAVPLGGLNALHFMRKARIQLGEKVLINGAGGSIGAHAVQIAKSLGAHVTAVDSTLKEGMLRRIGADDFIDYEKQDFAASSQSFDVILDMVAGSSYSACINTLNPCGRYLMANPSLVDMVCSAFTNRFTNKVVSFAFARESREELTVLREMIERGEVLSIVDKVYQMDQAADAHRRVETEQRCGAVVIAISNSQ
jgi:NADPH:quinone reductase-like Zn-dependent oxidoreductase